MISSTPSPSAQELADYLVEAAKVLRDESLDGVAMPETAEILDQSATLLRRLSETERERDEALQRVQMLEDDRRRAGDAMKIACGDLWGLGHPAYIMVHVREELEKMTRLWKELAVAKSAAEAGRDRLREMLAQADAVIEHIEGGADCRPQDGDCPFGKAIDEAIARHRLSQKGK